MPVKLRREHIVPFPYWPRKAKNPCEIARQMGGVTESTVRYHLKREAEGATDGRKDKPFKAEAVAEVIAAWFEERRDAPRPVNVQEFFEHLVYDYDGSYKSLVRYVRREFPPPKKRTYPPRTEKIGRFEALTGRSPVLAPRDPVVREPIGHCAQSPTVGSLFVSFGRTSGADTVGLAVVAILLRVSRSRSRRRPRH